MSKCIFCGCEYEGDQASFIFSKGKFDEIRTIVFEGDDCKLDITSFCHKCRLLSIFLALSLHYGDRLNFTIENDTEHGTYLLIDLKGVQ